MSENATLIGNKISINHVKQPFSTNKIQFSLVFIVSIFGALFMAIGNSCIVDYIFLPTDIRNQFLKIGVWSYYGIFLFVLLFSLIGLFQEKINFTTKILKLFPFFFNYLDTLIVFSQALLVPSALLLFQKHHAKSTCLDIIKNKTNITEQNALLNLQINNPRTGDQNTANDVCEGEEIRAMWLSIMIHIALVVILSGKLMMVKVCHGYLNRR
jgi:hypothetical protein